VAAERPDVYSLLVEHESQRSSGARCVSEYITLLRNCAPFWLCGAINIWSPTGPKNERIDCIDSEIVITGSRTDAHYR